MTESDLICNFRKCRKRLKDWAWVTSCSHIYCDEDGAREFSYSSKICPACNTNLSGKYDIIKTDLQPSEQYKSMLLSGQKPETIMEICSRALNFWTYQTHQERTCQEYVINKTKENIRKLEQYHEEVVARTQTEITSMKSQLATLRKDNENLKKQCSELMEKITEKNRQYQKLQGMYDSMKRKSINPMSLELERVGQLTPKVHIPSNQQGPFDLPFATAHDLLRQRGAGDGPSGARHAAITSPSHDRDFVLRPDSTPLAPCWSRFSLPSGADKAKNKSK